MRKSCARMAWKPFWNTVSPVTGKSAESCWKESVKESRIWTYQKAVSWIDRKAAYEAAQVRNAQCRGRFIRYYFHKYQLLPQSAGEPPQWPHNSLPWYWYPHGPEHLQQGGCRRFPDIGRFRKCCGAYGGWCAFRQRTPLQISWRHSRQTSRTYAVCG